MQQIVATSRRLYQVDSREDTLVRERAVQLDLRVTCTLELLEDHLVHLRTGIYESGSDDCERSATLDVTGSTEESLRLLQGVGINTTGKHLTRGRSHRVIGTCQTGDRIEEDHDIVSALNHTLGLLQHDTSDLHMTVGGFIEGRGDHLCIYGAGHICYLLRTLVDEQHHDISLRMVGSDSVGDILHEDGLTSLWLGYDERTLSLTDW